MFNNLSLPVTGCYSLGLRKFRWPVHALNSSKDANCQSISHKDVQSNPTIFSQTHVCRFDIHLFQPSPSQHSNPRYMYRILPSLNLRIPILSSQGHENIHNHQKALFNKQSPAARRNQSIRSFPSISSSLLHAIIRRYGCRCYQSGAPLNRR